MIGENGSSNLTHIVEGWQIPILLTVNLSAPVIDMPEGETLVMGLYQSVFGGSWRDSRMTTLSETTFTFTKLIISQEVSLTAGYILFKTDASSPYAQKFERVNGSAIKVTKYQVYVPFSGWQDGQEITYVINHVITDEDINY